jgi:putative membrane protein insertion efficiency factor
MRVLIRALIRAYQLFVSPLCAPHCRFYPSCSQYALEAVTVHGSVRGGTLALRRLIRCHPWHPGGYDPVPATAGSPGAAPPERKCACHADHR